MKAMDTGKTLEAIILPALARNGYEYETQVNVGLKPHGGKHVIDVLANTPTKSVLISLKWQQSSGSTEQKIPYELICLQHAIDAHQSAFEKAYLVLGGDGWSKKEFYISGGLEPYLKTKSVDIVSLDGFLSKINKKAL